MSEFSLTYHLKNGISHTNSAETVDDDFILGLQEAIKEGKECMIMCATDKKHAFLFSIKEVSTIEITQVK